MRTIPFIGYSDKLSGRAGDTIAFKVSSYLKSDYSASLFRSISADPNPDGPGIIEESCENIFKTRKFRSRKQKFFPGSYGITAENLLVGNSNNVSLSAKIFPTQLNDQDQTIISFDKLAIGLGADNSIYIRYSNSCLRLLKVTTERVWLKVTGSLSCDGILSIEIRSVKDRKILEKKSIQIKEINKINLSGRVSVAAIVKNNIAKYHFNGKIENPKIFSDKEILAKWNFSRNISRTFVKGENTPRLHLVNFPTRAVTSSKWNGTQMNWRYKNSHYAAIHFHEDDIYEFNWHTDFTFKIPETMPSGIYVMRIRCEKYTDAIPFFVCPKLGKETAKLCILISTFTYVIYGNHARPDYSTDWQSKIRAWNAYPYNAAEYKEYGMSTYNYHKDGSGICHASHRRPLLNLRPGYITFGQTSCSGLRHFQADSHLISWLHAKKIPYDIITDDELHNEGYQAIKNYKALATGTHPEYHTAQTLSALLKYRDNGGSINYLGGNGFYWRIARHRENPAMLEIRRAEDGLRAWAAEPGEYYHAFDGEYGGLWRRNGSPPQKLVGVGFTAQGNFIGMPYKRLKLGRELDWIFKGIKEEVIGDFGFSGNGAAGFELDRTDKSLDGGMKMTIIAQSYDLDNEFMLVPEEQLTHLTNLSGESEDKTKRADMVYFEVAGGGSVFSVGSITFCGSLPWNNFSNNISQLLYNILSKKLREKAKKH